MNRRHVAAWASYDFANSIYPAVIVTAAFSPWYAETIVGNESGLGDQWWGWVLSGSALFVAVTSPVMGAIADRAGVRKQLMILYTIVCVVAVSGFTVLEPGMIVTGFVLALIANIGFEGALVFYNAYLPEIAPRTEQGRVSGIGFAVGYAGSAIGIGVAIPFVINEAYDGLWLAVGCFFLLFSLPAFLVLPNDPGRGDTVRQAAVAGLTGFRRILGDVWGDRELRRFLIAFFVYIDGVVTVIGFASVFAATTFGFEPLELLALFLVVQISALVGATVLARPADTWGPRRVITLSLALWCALGIAAFLIQTKEQFWVVAVLAGFNLGSIQAASRSYMAALIPVGKEAEMFGFYALCGKASSVIGPAVFALVSRVSGGNQRLAFLAITTFFLIGAILLQRVRDPVRDSLRDPSPAP